MAGWLAPVTASTFKLTTWYTSSVIAELTVLSRTRCYFSSGGWDHCQHLLRPLRKGWLCRMQTELLWVVGQRIKLIRNYNALTRGHYYDVEHRMQTTVPCTLRLETLAGAWPRVESDTPSSRRRFKAGVMLPVVRGPTANVGLTSAGVEPSTTGNCTVLWRKNHAIGHGESKNVVRNLLPSQCTHFTTCQNVIPAFRDCLTQKTHSK